MFRLRVQLLFHGRGSASAGGPVPAGHGTRLHFRRAGSGPVWKISSPPSRSSPAPGCRGNAGSHCERRPNATASRSPGRCTSNWCRCAVEVRPATHCERWFGSAGSTAAPEMTRVRTGAAQPDHLTMQQSGGAIPSAIPGLRSQRHRARLFRHAVERGPDRGSGVQRVAGTPQGRWGRLPELAGACIFLSSAASTFVNGHTLLVDGGITACL